MTAVIVECRWGTGASPASTPQSARAPSRYLDVRQHAPYCRMTRYREASAVSRHADLLRTVGDTSHRRRDHEIRTCTGLRAACAFGNSFRSDGGPVGTDVG